ncbi:uncharacterized protein LOC132057704 [Lycium ferocissimum]|uniref:uncharacterized protein LOC132057704 n=1 Tax=Lycium ferocissimum TaxID=112874 RepID=UPI002815DFA5|nr:uncharacterized protein LOC132057704 [Lycium ferocissimum]
MRKRVTLLLLGIIEVDDLIEEPVEESPIKVDGTIFGIGKNRSSKMDSDAVLMASFAKTLSEMGNVRLSEEGNERPFPSIQEMFDSEHRTISMRDKTPDHGQNDHANESDEEDIPLVLKLRKGSGSKPASRKQKVGKFIAQSENERRENLKKQRLLLGRVVDPEISDKFGIKGLLKIIDFQKWSHLFAPPIPNIYEAQVVEFFSNLYCSDYQGTLITSVSGTDFELTEEVLGKILKVPTEGIRTITRTTSSNFKVMISQNMVENTSARASLLKKEMKAEYQLMFELVNKVLLPRADGRTVASIADLVLIEALSNFQRINLTAIMIEHIIKVVNAPEGKHGLPYGFGLTKVFEHFKVRTDKDTKGSNKHMFSIETLEECDCIHRKGGVGSTSTISTQLQAQERMIAELQRVKAENVLLQARLTEREKEVGSQDVLKAARSEIKWMSLRTRRFRTNMLTVNAWTNF